MATSCSMAVFLAVLAAALSASGRQPDWATGVTFAWQPDRGVVWQTPVATVYLDRSTGRSGPALHFAGTDLRRPLSSPKVERPDRENLVLRYQVAGPDGDSIDVLRRITLLRREGEAGMVEQFSLTPAKTINADLEIERPFSLLVGAGPRRPFSPSIADGRGPSRWPATSCGASGARQHHVGGAIAPPGFARGADRAKGPLARRRQRRSVFRLALQTFRRKDRQIVGAVRYRYAASQVPIGAGQTETRHFGVWLAAAKKGEPFGRSVDAFFRQVLPRVPPGPRWLQRIAMVGLRFSQRQRAGLGKGRQRVGPPGAPGERHHVALCFHGWYENLGGYSFDDAKQEIKPEWVAMGRTRKVHLTRDEVRRPAETGPRSGLPRAALLRRRSAPRQRGERLSAAMGPGAAAGRKTRRLDGAGHLGRHLCQKPGPPGRPPVVPATIWPRCSDPSGPEWTGSCGTRPFTFGRDDHA